MIRLHFNPLALGDFLDHRLFIVDPGTAMLIGTGISTLAGVGSGLTTGMGSRANRHEARRQFNESMEQHRIDTQMQYDYANMDWQRNRDAALEDWQRETEYNSASAVAARYRAAGLNPALMMQGSSAAQASMNAPAVSPAGASSQSASPTAAMPDPMGLGNSIQSTGNALRQSLSDYFNFQIQEQQAKRLGIENDHLDNKFIAEIMNMRQDYQNKLSEQSNTRAYNKILHNQIDLLDEQLFNMIQMRDFKLQSDFDSARQVHIMNDNLLAQGRALNVQANLAEEFGRSEALKRLQISDAQLNQIAQSIVESKARTKEAAAREAQTILETAGLPGVDTPAGRAAMELIELQIRQQGADYWNPFNYVGKAFGGSAGFTKVIK